MICTYIRIYDELSLRHVDVKESFFGTHAQLAYFPHPVFFADENLRGRNMDCYVSKFNC